MTIKTVKLSIEVPATIQADCANVGKYELNLEAIKPEHLNAAISYLIANGFSQSIRDSYAGKKGSEARVQADQRLAAIHTGSVGTRAGGDELSSTIRTILGEGARQFKVGENVKKWSELSPADRTAKVQAVRDAKEGTPQMAVLVEAKKRIAAKSALTVEAF